MTKEKCEDDAPFNTCNQTPDQPRGFGVRQELEQIKNRISELEKE